MNLSAHPAIVVVIHREGCGACQEFVPRARAIAARWASCCPTVFLDSDENRDWCDRVQIQYTPTLLALRHGRIVRRHEGLVPDEAVESAYAELVTGCRPHAVPAAVQ